MTGAVARVAAVAVALLAGCGGDEATTPATSALTAAAVREAPERVRAERTFAFTATYTREVPEREAETYMTLTGAVDVGGSGRMEADLSALFPDSSQPLGVEEPFRLRWTPERLTAVVDGREQSRGRADARVGAGLLGRLPDEPLGVLDLLDEAEGMRRVGDERVADVATAHFAGRVDPFRAGQGAVPAEFGLGLRQLLAEPRLPLDVWLDAGGRPRRIQYVFRLKPLESGDTQVLPARSIRGVYELSSFGEPVGDG